VASVAVTAAVLAGQEAAYGAGELAILLCLLVIALRGCTARWAAVCGVLAGAAVFALPYREAGGESDISSVNPFAQLVLAGLAAGLGGDLRTLDHRRSAAITETRRAERLAMAADLHDFVAHHVTGILVQAQVGQLFATTEPERVGGILKDVERAATEARASMRRTVGIVREEWRSGRAARPGGGLRRARRPEGRPVPRPFGARRAAP
ncbi:histidine kinase, partial [Streptomyces sp. WM6386]|uniref:histidine kinase n=1 Tax=Streptomyces sp. WM6386 TaxID=1415558 RepID=UPI000A5C8A50